MSEYSVTDLGAVTAYAQAVENGYTGTLEQWVSLQINSANNYNELFNEIYSKNTSAALWEQGGLSPTTGATATSTVRIRTTDFLPDSIAKIVVSAGYYVIVVGYADDGTYIGVLKNDYVLDGNVQEVRWETNLSYAASCITGTVDLRRIKNFYKENWSGETAFQGLKFKVLGAAGELGTNAITPNAASNFAFYENNVGYAVDNDLIGIGSTEPDSERAVMWINDADTNTIQVPQIDDAHTSDVDTWSSQKINNEVGNLKTAIGDVAPTITGLRNGTPSNTGNQSAVAIGNILPYNDATSIRIKVKRPKPSGVDSYRISITTYTVDDGLSQNNVSNRVTADRFYDTDEIHVYKGLLDSTSIGFTVGFLQLDSSGNYVPLRVTDFTLNDFSIIYDYTDSTLYAPASLAGVVEANTNGITENAEKIERNASDIEVFNGFSETLLWSGSGSKRIDRQFKTGDVYDLVVEFAGTTSDNGQKNLQIYDDSDTRIALLYGNTSRKLTIPSDTEFLSFVVSKTGTWTDFGVSAGISRQPQVQCKRVFHVEKNGSGDFVKLIDAINEAELYNNSIVYVGEGTWDILDELGDTYLSNVSSTSTTWGIVLKNGIHLIFSTKAEVVANYTGDNSNVKTYLSVFNSGEGGFILENCKIRSSNIRYCVHDDRGSMTTPYHNKYINCDMYHDNSGNTDFGGWQCIGGGFGINGDIEIVGCTFDGHNQWGDFGGIVSYHNSSSASAQSKLTIRDCYFAGSYTIRVSWYGTSTEISKVYVTGCRLGQEIVHQAELQSSTVQNTSVISWNNEISN